MITNFKGFSIFRTCIYFEIVIRMINFSLAPMAASILFGLGFSPKDTAYSGRKVVMKNYGFAPKKNTNISTDVFKLFKIILDQSTVWIFYNNYRL